MEIALWRCAATCTTAKCMRNGLERAVRVTLSRKIMGPTKERAMRTINWMTMVCLMPAPTSLYQRGDASKCCPRSRMPPFPKAQPTCERRAIVYERRAGECRVGAGLRCLHRGADVSEGCGCACECPRVR